ncbi:2Fe-2S iron-sulfur cluster-binding protein [Bdellovibrio sp. KM01]|uniref:2Fe-2S iron-sulfur cluster-binding protein n=1 Tax=Bdellovibrio sp. KM01 TaxID=2748865 RepID=UPI0015E9F9A5|nr:2Fe-2S iron-sulfur cluster-binding protein [Bdellovibrio sp. KM01]QLY24453.1 (2Fe-2S)-binding protein [Bdellovibrio sp. KM01]
MKIKFLPQNIEVEGTPDKSLLQIATENHLEIRSICKGVPSCAECRVRIKEGDNNVLPPGKAELSLIGTSYFIDGRRLSCQVRCFGDVTVDLTEQVERAENQTKKIRGFRTSKQMESKAVNDTMLLDTKVDEAALNAQNASAGGHVAPEKSLEESQAPQQAKQQQHGNQQRQQNRPQQNQNPQKQKQPQHHNQKQGGGQQQKGQQQAKQGGGQTQQPKQHNQNQQKPKQGGGQNQNQNQNRQHNQPKQNPNQQKQQNQQQPNKPKPQQ